MPQVKALYSIEQNIPIHGCHGYHKTYLPLILQQKFLPFSETLTKLMLFVRTYLHKYLLKEKVEYVPILFNFNHGNSGKFMKA